MIDLKKLELGDIPLIKSFLVREGSQNCDLSAGCLFMWRDMYSYHYAIVNNTLIIAANFDDSWYFSFPMGEDVSGALEELEKYCALNSIPLVFYTLDKNQLSTVCNRYPAYITVSDRDWSDYIYDYESFKELSGKKYSAQRNHINKFLRLYPDYHYKEVEKEDIPEILDFIRNFKYHAEKESADAEEDLRACTEVLENYEAYGLKGGVLRADGKIIGFTAGEISGDTLIVHIEKADYAYDGVYQMLSNLFLKQNEGRNIKYVNREDDAGDPGLRKSKLSYNPAYLLAKTTAYIGGYNESKSFDV